MHRSGKFDVRYDMHKTIHCTSTGSGDLDKIKSIIGYVFKVAGGVVSWVSKLQLVVATSTIEAEYVAATQASKEAIWLKMLLEELGHNQEYDSLFCGIQSALHLARNPTFHSRTKHIRVQYHFIREKMEEGKFSGTFKEYVIPSYFLMLEDPPFGGNHKDNKTTSYYNKTGWRDTAPKSEEGRKKFIASLHKRKTELFMALIENRLLPLRPGVAKLILLLAIYTLAANTLSVELSSYTADEDFLTADAVFDCIGDPPEERFDLAFCASLVEKQYVS
ncbi:hypothetical protein F3Y22_tig00112353pilonHSYRG00040 [Hibiscus syriacus]|uniref:Uncharacterized protein n=1 Tax=Hibiscus syriacus TaxID=106335 RepID=A0A6A2YAV6_HIBSY|nr:hypothetical protein F3Y22_tig00112353pilonHSYRG00040 [Hibiscus syriacus]